MLGSTRNKNNIDKNLIRTVKNSRNEKLFIFPLNIKIAFEVSEKV